MCRLIFHSLILRCLEALLQLIEPVCDSGFRPEHNQIIIIPRWLLSFDIAFIYQGDAEHGRCNVGPLRFTAAVTRSEHQRAVISQNPHKKIILPAMYFNTNLN